jgi:hypothetical protein
MKKPQTIPSKNMSAFLDANKRDTRLLGSVERHILSKPFEARAQNVLHPSDIIKSEWCALASYHALRGNYVEVREKPSLRLQSIFDEGHAIHSKWQGYFGEMGVLYGKWFDPKTNDYTWATSKDLVGLKNTIQYREVPLSSAKHKISGHSDGWIKGIGEDCLIEIKSIGAGTIRLEEPSLFGAENSLDTAWKNIRRPFNSHYKQGQVYLHLAHLMVEEGLLPSAPEEIVFLYELKADQSYKEFVVQYNPEHIASVFESALDVAWAVDNNRPPVCTVNPVKGCKRCEPFRGENEEDKNS